MARRVDTTEYLDMVCGLLAEGRENVPVTIRGVSMRPFLRDGDMAYLSPIGSPLRSGDILLFQQKGGRYILHRLHRILPDGKLLMLGDSQLTPEVIENSQIRGRVSFLRLGEKTVKPGSITWWFYAHPWRILAPWRKQIGALRRIFKRT